MINDVFLRKISLSDTSNIVRWRNSDSVRKNLYSQDLITEEQHVNYFHNYVETGKCLQYIIEVKTKEGKKDIGTVFLKNVDMRSHKAEFGIFIGETSERGKHYASKSAIKMLDKAFNEYKLHRVYLSVFSNNKPAIIAYVKAGFRQEGILKEDYFDGVNYIDIVHMGVIYEDWKLWNS